MDAQKRRDANVLWVYPERWPGWTAHLRVGGGLFDDLTTHLRILESCWRHYRDHTGQRLSPQTHLQIMLHPDAWERWHSHFHYLQEQFAPRVNNEVIPFSFALGQAADLDFMPEVRDFWFVLHTPEIQPLKCCFYLGQQRIGSVSLGEINLRGDRCQLAVHRRLGLTLGSVIQRCYQNSALRSMMPPKMLEDFRYVGWTFHFSQKAGQTQIEIRDIPNVGYLESGALLSQESLCFGLGEALEFYQGEVDGEPEADLLCHLVVVPEDEVPAPPELRQVELFLHTPAQGQPYVEARAWVHSVALQGDRLALAIEGETQALQLREGRRTDEGLWLYEGQLEEFGALQGGQRVRCSARGLNRYGLQFAQTYDCESQVREAVSAQYAGGALVPKEQLHRQWELHVRLDGPGDAPQFDLAAFTLWLGTESHPALQIPLANAVDHTLIFRYLPRAVHAQLSLDKLEKAQTLTLWLEQRRPAETPFPSNQWRLSCPQGQHTVTLGTLRVVDFDGRCRILPEHETVAFPEYEELLIEGTRLQMVPGLELAAPGAQEDEHWDLLLLEPKQGRRRVRLSAQAPGWMTAQLQHMETPGGLGTHTVRALWLSCGDSAQLIEDPKERNPEGGPALAFGLGLGQTNEMAQIRPSAEGFRLYRHRQHIAVHLQGHSLEVEPHGQAKGTLLSPGRGSGWVLIEQALLRYQYDAHLHLELTLCGYLFSRRGQTQTLSLAAGPEDTTKARDPRIAHLQLTREGHPVQLHLNVLSRPSEGALPQLLMQENRRDQQGEEALPQKLRVGRSVRRDAVELAFWEVRSQATHLPPEAQLSPSTLLLELMQPYGRKRFFLSTSYGQLGHWSRGSAFLSSAGPQQPLFAPTHERTLAGVQIPPGELIVGSDITQADLIIPAFFRPPASQLFSLHAQGKELCLRPLGAPCIPLLLQRQQDGRLQLQEAEAIQEISPISPPSQGRFFFRCGHLMFELSNHPKDCQEQPQTDFLLSIRGVFHDAKHPFAVGGTPHQTPLPVLDPVAHHPPEEPLLYVYAPDLQLRYTGDGLVGLRQPSSQESLCERLRQELLHEPPWPSGPPNPLHCLLHLHPQPTQPAADSSVPPLCGADDADDVEASLAHFLTQGSQLQIGAQTLSYRFRGREDGYPPIDRIPSWLAFTQPPSLTLRMNEEGTHFLDAQGETLDGLVIGRMDADNPAEFPPAQSQDELFLSRSYLLGERRVAKLVLHGYSPRKALHLRIEQGEPVLEVPPPRAAGSYHVTIDGKPCRKAQRLPLREAVSFHINHLFLCTIHRSDGDLRFTLRGFLLGHQQDPSLPVTVQTANRVGVIHLRGLTSQTTLQLTPATAPAHFLHQSTDTQAPTRQQAPIALAKGERCALVDLKRWTQRPPTWLAPPNTDRLLWFLHDDPASSACHFTPEQQAHARYANDEGSSFAFGPPSDEGSSFAFGPPSDEGSSFAFGPPSDEGSSFAFGPPSDEGSSFAFGPAQAKERNTPTQTHQRPTPQEVHEAEADTLEAPIAKEAKQAPIAALQLGWFRPSHRPAGPHYGFLRNTEGPQIQLAFRAGCPTAHAPAQGAFSQKDTNIPMASLWRRGELVSLEAPQELQDGDLLLCAEAAFAVEVAAEGKRVSVTRRWLWLPSRRLIHLVGEHQLDALDASVDQDADERAKAPKAQDAAAKSDQTPQGPAEDTRPPEEPGQTVVLKRPQKDLQPATKDAPPTQPGQGQELWLGLTQVARGALSQVFPRERGHRLEHLSGATTGWRIASHVPQDGQEREE